MPRMGLQKIGSLALVALWFVSSGCDNFTWFINDNRLQNKLEAIDADGDGVPNPYDCDDSDPLKRPGTLADLDPMQQADFTAPPDWVDPEWVDIPYDAIDNDCNNGDLVDVDGDLFPGRTREEYAAQAVSNGLFSSVEAVPWPQNVFEDQVDCRDTDPQIFPNAPDTPYNGLDEDCNFDNDYDADGDGQMRPSENPADVTAFADSIGIVIDVNAPNAFGDCLDTDADVFAGNPNDVPYDGADSNCDGSNDFDIDGDGYRPNGYDADFDAFVALYHPVNPPAWVAENQPGDCLDQVLTVVDLMEAAPALVGYDPALVNPGILNDVPYDGVDADCAGDTDFDADGDLYEVMGMDTEILAYVSNWSVGLPPHWTPTISSTSVDSGDCDDDNNSVAPGNLEVMGDALDSDCDGASDTTPFAYSTLAWDRPSWPRVVRNDRHYLVATDARWALLRTLTLETPLPNACPTLFFEASDPTLLPSYKADPERIVLWANPNPDPQFNDPRSAGVDLVSIGDTMYVGSSYFSPNANTYKMGFVQRTYIAPPQNDYSTVQLATKFNAFVGFESDVDVTFVPDGGANPAEGWLWMTMCGGNGRDTPYAPPDTISGDPDAAVLRQMVMRAPFQTVLTSQVIPISPDGPGGGTVELTGNTADVCWHELDQVGDIITGTVHVCDIDGCQQFTSTVEDVSGGVGDPEYVGNLDTIPAVDTEYDGRGIIEADVHDDLLVLVEAAGLTIKNLDTGVSSTLFAGEAVVSGDAMITDGGILYAVAAIEAAPLNLLKVAYGPVDDIAGLVIVDMPVLDDDPLYVGGEGCDPDTLAHCASGRILEPRRVGLHADEQRVVVTVSAWTPDNYVPAEPKFMATGLQILEPIEQDAVGWIFLEPADFPTP